MKRAKSATIISSGSSSDSEEEEEEWKSRPKRVKRVESSSDESSESGPEEGELSSEQEEEDDGLDEDLMGDEADRKRLAQMTEKEREEELFKRAEMREAMKARRSVKEKLREEKRRRQKQLQRQSLNQQQHVDEKEEGKDPIKEKDRSKRRDVSAPGSSQSASRGTVGTSRQKALEEKRNGANKFAQLIERRKAKLKTSEIFSDEDESSSSSSDSDSDDLRPNAVQENKKKLPNDHAASSAPQRQGRNRRRGRDSDVSSRSSVSSLTRNRRQRDASASISGSSPERSPSRSSSPSVSEEGECRRSESSGDEGVSWSRGTSKKNALIESREELLRIKLSRFKTEKWVHMPFFKNLVIGCFVRVGIGNRDGIAIYRIAEIEDVVETGKIYDLGSTRTNKGLILRHGEDKQMFRLCFLSNQDFSQSEWEKWLASMSVAKMSLPSRSFVNKKEQEIMHALNHRIEDEAELERILDEKKRFRRGPTNYTVQKIELLKERQVAENQGDTSKVARLNLEITDLESEANERERRRTSAIKSITYINERNRAQNLKLAEEASKREFEEMEEMQRNGMQDPFSRLQTRPVLFGKKRQQGQEANSKHEDETKQSELKVQKPKTSDISSGHQDHRSEIEESKKDGTGGEGAAGDVFSIHNFDINIDLDVPLSAPLPPSVPVNASTGTSIIAVSSNGVIGTPSGPSLVGSRRGLNLEEYKKRRGLI